MLKRKGSVLLASMAAAALVATTGFSVAQDEEETELHKTMVKVQANNAKILKGTRNAVMFKKSQKDVAEAAEDLVKLGKKAREETGPAKETKQPQEKWTGLMDAFIKEADGFAKDVAKPTMKQADAKAAFKAVTKTCTECHNVFRPDLEE